MKDKSDAKGPAHLGARDFLDFVYDLQPEWTLLAVKAPVEPAAGAFADLRKTDSWLHDVPRRPAGSVDDMDPSQAVALQIRGSPWTVIIRQLGFATSAAVKEIVQDARALSTQFNTLAIAFYSDDATGMLEYDLFESGKLIERAQWEEGAGFQVFKSTLRKQPELEEIGMEFIDDVFRQQGIYLPACYARSEEEDAWICVQKVSEGAIERADLIGLEGPEDEEEEDEEDEEDEE